MKKQDSIDRLLALYEKHMPATVYLMRNPERYDKIAKAMEELKSFIDSIEDSATFSITKDELIGTSITLEVRCDLISFTEVDQFCSAIKMVDSIDIVPTDDGRLSVVFGFNDAYIPAPPKQ